MSKTDKESFQHPETKQSLTPIYLNEQEVAYIAETTIQTIVSSLNDSGELISDHLQVVLEIFAKVASPILAIILVDKLTTTGSLNPSLRVLIWNSIAQVSKRDNDFILQNHLLDIVTSSEKSDILANLTVNQDLEHVWKILFTGVRENSFEIFVKAIADDGVDRRLAVSFWGYARRNPEIVTPHELKQLLRTPDKVRKLVRFNQDELNVLECEIPEDLTRILTDSHDREEAWHLLREYATQSGKQIIFFDDICDFLMSDFSDAERNLFIVLLNEQCGSHREVKQAVAQACIIYPTRSSDKAFPGFLEKIADSAIAVFIARELVTKHVDLKLLSDEELISAKNNFMMIVRAHADLTTINVLNKLLETNELPEVFKSDIANFVEGWNNK